jgi:formyltetrahydrofolate-dependent phosphoribosylglycinamide formyltransferase
MDRPIRLAVLISGGGTTLQNFVERIHAGQMQAAIRLVITSNAAAGGVERARQVGLPVHVVRREEYDSVASFSDAIFDLARAAAVDLVTLAGFLKRIRVPADFTARVMNIHPALIPSFCGKGFFGHRVHEAVLEAGVKVTGCTVHFVDDEYDHGPIILQRCVAVHDDDTAETLAARVFAQECEAYPEAIRLFAAGRLSIRGRRVLLSGEPGRASAS